MVLASTAAVLLGGCASASRAKAAANGCGSGKHGARLTLVLNDVSPIPHLAATTGSYVEVVSSHDGNQMAFPAAHPSTAVCEISEERSTDGTASVLYETLRPGTVTFSSTYTHATALEMPAMLGRLVIAAPRSASRI